MHILIVLLSLGTVLLFSLKMTATNNTLLGCISICACISSTIGLAFLTILAIVQFFGG